MDLYPREGKFSVEDNEQQGLGKEVLIEDSIIDLFDVDHLTFIEKEKL